MRQLAGTLILLLLMGKASNAVAQRLEIDPYAGGFFPQKLLNIITVNKEGIYGVKAGFRLTRSIEAEANLGYINNLSFADTLTRKKAYIWDGAVSYHLRPAPKFYVTAGLGGITTTVSSDSRYFFNPVTLANDHFLSISYGGGIKVLRKWGPFGYRTDVRGRTLPHYYGLRFSWLETTAGVTVSFSGERSK